MAAFERAARGLVPLGCAFCTGRGIPGSDATCAPRAQCHRGSGRGSHTEPCAPRFPEAERLLRLSLPGALRTRSAAAGLRGASRGFAGVSAQGGRVCLSSLHLRLPLGLSALRQHSALLGVAGIVPRCTRPPRPGRGPQGIPQAAGRGLRRAGLSRGPDRSPPMPVPAPFGGIPGSGGRTAQRLLVCFLHSALRNLGFRVDEQTWQSFSNVRIHLWVFS